MTDIVEFYANCVSGIFNKVFVVKDVLESLGTDGVELWDELLSVQHLPLSISVWMSSLVSVLSLSFSSN